MSETRTFVEYASAHNFAQTLVRLEDAIAQAGLTVFARIDHAGAAQSVGLTMPHTTVLIYGHPRGGTPIMLATPAAALDLPLRALVREAGGSQIFVGFHPIVPLLREAGVAEQDAARLSPAQALLVEAIKP